MKKILLLLLFVALAAAGWWVYKQKTTPPEYLFSRARRETLVSTLSTNGKVEPIEWVAVHSEVTGAVEKVPIQEGQFVQKGAPLAELNQAEARDELASAQAQVEAARAELASIEQGGKSAELAEIENNLARARFERDAAQRDYAALRRLQQKQAATAEDVESARGKLHQSEMEIEAFERKRAALVTKADRAAAEAKLRQAQSAAALAKEHLEQSVIRAPLSGVAYSVPIRVGAFLKPGDLVANIGRLDQVTVKVYVDEPELGRVAKGQPVTITWDAFGPSKQWTGVVDKMPSQIDTVGTRQVGEVLCRIDNPNRELVPGTNVNVAIESKIVPNALTIPKEALHRETGELGVYLLQGDKVVWRKVTVGASSVTRVQVLQGLSDNDAVALPSERSLKPGDRVTPVYR